jgi:hypothetical protein
VEAVQIRRHTSFQRSDSAQVRQREPPCTVWVSIRIHFAKRLLQLRAEGSLVLRRHL